MHEPEQSYQPSHPQPAGRGSAGLLFENILDDAGAGYARHALPLLLLSGVATALNAWEFPLPAGDTLGHESPPLPVAAVAAAVYGRWDIAAGLAGMCIAKTLGPFLAYAVACRLAAPALSGRTGFGDALRDVALALPSLLGSMGMLSLLLSLVALTLVGLPYALYLTVRWAFTVQAVVIDSTDAFGALYLSWDAVKGKWWRTFFTLLAIGTLLALLPLLAALPFGDTAVPPAVAAAAVQWLLWPLLPLATTAYYRRLTAGFPWAPSRYGRPRPAG